jgi:hypothetical protein
MRSVADQFIQISRREPQVACNAIKLCRVEMTHLVQLPAVPEPFAESMRQSFDGGKAMVLGGHGIPPVASKILRILPLPGPLVVALGQTCGAFRGDLSG